MKFQTLSHFYPSYVEYYYIKKKKKKRKSITTDQTNISEKGHLQSLPREQQVNEAHLAKILKHPNIDILTYTNITQNK